MVPHPQLTVRFLFWSFALNQSGQASRFSSCNDTPLRMGVFRRMTVIFVDDRSKAEPNWGTLAAQLGVGRTQLHLRCKWSWWRHSYAMWEMFFLLFPLAFAFGRWLKSECRV